MSYNWVSIRNCVLSGCPCWVGVEPRGAHSSPDLADALRGGQEQEHHDAPPTTIILAVPVVRLSDEEAEKSQDLTQHPNLFLRPALGPFC